MNGASASSLRVFDNDSFNIVAKIIPGPDVESICALTRSVEATSDDGFPGPGAVIVSTPILGNRVEVRRHSDEVVQNCYWIMQHVGQTVTVSAKSEDETYVRSGSFNPELFSKFFLDFQDLRTREPKICAKLDAAHYRSKQPGSKIVLSMTMKGPGGESASEFEVPSDASDATTCLTYSFKFGDKTPSFVDARVMAVSESGAASELGVVHLEGLLSKDEQQLRLMLNRPAEGEHRSMFWRFAYNQPLSFDADAEEEEDVKELRF